MAQTLLIFVPIHWPSLSTLAFSQRGARIRWRHTRFLATATTAMVPPYEHTAGTGCFEQAL
jgi:hypothetical protein